MSSSFPTTLQVECSDPNFAGIYVLSPVRSQTWTHSTRRLSLHIANKTLYLDKWWDNFSVRYESEEKNLGDDLLERPSILSCHFNSSIRYRHPPIEFIIRPTYENQPSLPLQNTTNTTCKMDEQTVPENEDLQTALTAIGDAATKFQTAIQTKQTQQRALVAKLRADLISQQQTISQQNDQLANQEQEITELQAQVNSAQQALTQQSQSARLRRELTQKRIEQLEAQLQEQNKNVKGYAEVRTWLKKLNGLDQSQKMALAGTMLFSVLKKACK